MILRKFIFILRTSTIVLCSYAEELEQRRKLHTYVSVKTKVDHVFELISFFTGLTTLDISQANMHS